MRVNGAFLAYLNKSTFSIMHSGEHGHQHAVNSSSWSEYEIHRAQNQKFYKSYITKTMKQFHLKEVSKERFKAFEIGKDYELKDFITNELKREFKIGHTFYEFQREIEPICEHKEVIFIHEVDILVCYLARNFNIVFFL